jgi:hypothetical protein
LRPEAGVNVALSPMSSSSRLIETRIVFDLPVAERPEDLVGDGNRAGRGFGLSGGVERHEPAIAARVEIVKPGAKARSFGETTLHGRARAVPVSGPRAISAAVRRRGCDW